MYKWNRVIRAGSNEIRLEGESQSLRDFWAEMAFWDSLPQAGPNGEADLQFSYRSPKGNDYYSILCPDAEQEYKFGILKADPQQLFPKRWERAKHGEYRHDDDEEGPPPEKSKQAAMPAPTRTAPARPATPTIGPSDEVKALALQIEAQYKRINANPSWIAKEEAEEFQLEEWFAGCRLRCTAGDLRKYLARLTEIAVAPLRIVGTESRGELIKAIKAAYLAADGNEKDYIDYFGKSQIGAMNVEQLQELLGKFEQRQEVAA